MRPRILPTDTELIKMKQSGLTHAQIADKISQDTGHKIARSSVSVALARAGAAKPNKRYKEELPWVVRSTHHTEYPVRMLRSFGRRKSGEEQDPNEVKRLEAWLSKLEDSELVVAYCPDAPDGQPGFVYVTAEAKDHNKNIPIRIEPVRPEQVGYSSTAA